MENIVEINDVSKKFKGFSLEHLNLNIKKGYITGFIGTNGAGKSSTIKLIMNLIHPDSGDIKVFNESYEDKEIDIKDRIGFVYDSNVYYEGLNLSSIKSFVTPSYTHWDDKAFYHYIKKFELPLDKPMKKFSKGMQMKASLALALSHHPEFLIMDEPTAGLDPIFRKELLNILQELMLDEERTIFFSTHITTDLEKIADYIAFIKDGEIIFNYSTAHIQDEFAIVKGDTELLDKDTEKEFTHIKRHSYSFEALTVNKEKVFQIFGDSVVIENTSIEEVMYFLNEEGVYG